MNKHLTLNELERIEKISKISKIGVYFYIPKGKPNAYVFTKDNGSLQEIVSGSMGIFDRDIYKGVVMVLYMLPGMPNLYYGDEVLLEGKLGSNEGARYPMEWRDEYQDKDMLSFYIAMGEARKEEWLGFSSYSVMPLDEKAFAILRFVEGKALVSVINRGDSREVSLPQFLLPSKKISVVVGDGKVTRECDSFRILLKDKESLLIRLEN